VIPGQATEKPVPDSGCVHGSSGLRSDLSPLEPAQGANRSAFRTDLCFGITRTGASAEHAGIRKPAPRTRARTRSESGNRARHGAVCFSHRRGAWGLLLSDREGAAVAKRADAIQRSAGPG